MLLSINPMPTKFSQDMVSLSDLKVNPGKIVRHTTDSGRPVLLTSRGRGVAVVPGLAEYERNGEENGCLISIRSMSLEQSSSRATPLESGPLHRSFRHYKTGSS